MTMIIHKYTIHVGVNKFEFPEGHKVLCVQAQGDEIQMWVAFNPDVSHKVTRYFMAFMTGVGIHERLSEFIGTIQLEGGSLVFHVFEVIPTTINEEEIVS